MTSSILISVSALVFSIWFGGAFLHQGYRAANRSLIIIGLAFLLFVIPFLGSPALPVKQSGCSSEYTLT